MAENIHIEPNIQVNILQGDNNEDFFSGEESELNSIVMDNENDGWITVERNQKKRHHTDSDDAQEVNKKKSFKDKENVYGLDVSNMSKVDACKSNVTHSSNVILSGIPVADVNNSVNLTEIGGKFVFVSSVNGLKIFDNPKIVKKMLSDSVLSDYIVGTHQVKGRGKSIKIQVKNNTNINLGLITQMGNNPVTAWYLMGENCTVGVISPISPDLDVVQDILPNLQDNNIDSKLIDIKRFTSRDGKCLDLVKLVFNGPLPETILWDRQEFKVRPFHFLPTYCRTCFRYGHGKSSCTGKFLCPHCGNNHKAEECNQTTSEGFMPKCQHCKLYDHTTASKKCMFFKLATDIENQKRKGEISYREAQRKYNQLNNETLDSLKMKDLVEIKQKNPRGLGGSMSKKTNINSILPQTAHLDEKSMHDLNTSLTDVGNHNNNRFEILSEDDLSLSDSDISSGNEGQSYANILGNGNSHKNEQGHNKIRSKAKRKINVGVELRNLDSDLDYDSGESLYNEGKKKFQQSRGSNKKDDHASRLDTNHNTISNGESTSTNFLVKIVKKILNFYKKPNKNLDMYIEFILQILEVFQSNFDV